MDYVGESTLRDEPCGKMKIDEIIVTEGKYDKIKLESIFDATIIITGGFSIFNDDKKASLLKRLAAKCGMIILTDSDRAGFAIRNYLKNICRGSRILHAYVPDILGKESRKAEPSKEGTLGVEGISAEIVRKAVLGALPENFAAGCENGSSDCSGEKEEKLCVTKADFYALGLSGGAGSAARREKLCLSLELPCNLSANALLNVINVLCSREELLELVK